MDAQDELSPPRLELALRLRDGRKLGLAEYGPAQGRPLLWFHGTPGARRQIPPRARRLAEERGIRLIAVERPGVGGSTPHLHRSIADSVADIEELADRLEIERFGLVGLSGGGPYVLAVAHALPARVVSAAVLGGVAPSQGPEAVAGGLVGLAKHLEPLVRLARAPLGQMLWAFSNLARPFEERIFQLYALVSPEGDRRVIGRPEMRAMFLDDLADGSRRQFDAPVLDLLLLSRPWGFSLREIRVPVRFWHGDSDHIVPLEHGEHLAKLVPGADLRVRSGESHLGCLDAADEVFAMLLEHWPEAEPSAAERPESAS